MRTLIILLIASLAFSACSKLDIEKDVPQVIKDKIKTFSESSTICSDGKVDEYSFQSQTVYVFDPGINCGADMTSEVVNSDGETLGYLGGLAGTRRINCEDVVNAEYGRTVWKN